MGREGVWGWRVACVFAYGGASAVAAWGLSLLVACVHGRTAAVVERVHPCWCCLLLHVCTRRTSKGLHACM